MPNQPDRIPALSLHPSAPHLGKINPSMKWGIRRRVISPFIFDLEQISLNFATTQVQTKDLGMASLAKWEAFSFFSIPNGKAN